MKALNDDIEKKKTAVFEEFFLSKDLADVIFKVEGKEFPCHKLILAKANQYFFKMFTSNGPILMTIYCV